MGRGRAWTIKEIEKLKLLYEYELPQIEIAERLDRSLDAVKTKLKDLRREEEDV